MEHTHNIYANLSLSCENRICFQDNIEKNAPQQAQNNSEEQYRKYALEFQKIQGSLDPDDLNRIREKILGGDKKNKLKSLKKFLEGIRKAESSEDKKKFIKKFLKTKEEKMKNIRKTEQEARKSDNKELHALYEELQNMDGINESLKEISDAAVNAEALLWLLIYVYKNSNDRIEKRNIKNLAEQLNNAIEKSFVNMGLVREFLDKCRPFGITEEALNKTAELIREKNKKSE